MNKTELIEAASDYLVHTYNRPEVVFEKGQGVYLYDSEGKEYLDFMSGIAVNGLGHSDSEWVEAVSSQAAQLTHVSNLFHTAPQLELAQRLVENSFADRVFFANTGSEANEGAVKFARKWAKSHFHSHKTKIVAFSGGFHGRSIGALSLTYKEQYRAPFAPLMPDVTFVHFNDLEAARLAVDDDTCAVIVEPVQGEGGVNPATAEFLQGLRALCDNHHALLIFDEVQCGLGRTGQLWAHQNYAITPDIMTLAKPLAGGLPIGAILVTQAVADVIQPGDHGSTFAGGPLVCRAAQVVFDRINRPDFLQQVAANGTYLQHQLRHLESPQIVAVRGLGLLVGVEMDTAVAPITAAAREKGLLLISAGEKVLRLAPPLIISQEQIDTAVAILAECLQENVKRDA
jgi:predicted acetylornithine/succinylornithine family transaminase